MAPPGANQKLHTMVHTLLTTLLLITSLSASAQKGLYTAAQEWPVKITDGWFTAKTISYGPYTTVDRKNGIAAGAAADFIKNPTSPFNFSVVGNDTKVLVQEISAITISFSNYSLPAFLENMPSTAPFLYVRINWNSYNDTVPFNPSETLTHWELILKAPTYLELNDDKPVGVLREDGKEKFRITAHNNFGKKNSYENICYEFHYRRKEIAAVIPGEKPRVWVNPDVPEELRPILAAAIGALLLR